MPIVANYNQITCKRSKATRTQLEKEVDVIMGAIESIHAMPFDMDSNELEYLFHACMAEHMRKMKIRGG